MIATHPERKRGYHLCQKRFLFGAFSFYRHSHGFNHIGILADKWYNLSMKKYKVPIFTEEHIVHVYLGELNEVIKAAAKYTGLDYETIESYFDNARGISLTQKGMSPLILINGDLPYYIAVATIAHEACHAVDDIIEYLKLDERSGEFRAHGVAAVMRSVGKDLHPRKKKKNL